MIAVNSQFCVVKESLMKVETNDADMQEKNRPPKNPSTVFLGEIEEKSFCLPNFFPIKYAKLSFTQIIIKHPKIMDGEYSPFRFPIRNIKIKAQEI
jgi:hypothetical protein